MDNILIPYIEKDIFNDLKNETIMQRFKGMEGDKCNISY